MPKAGNKREQLANERSAGLINNSGKNTYTAHLSFKSPVMLLTTSIADILGTVVRNRPLSQSVSIISIECPAIAIAAQPGNFVNIKVNDTSQPLLRRPFSIHNVQGEVIDLMVKSVGHGSALFCNIREGAKVMVLGPLGNSFTTGGLNVETALLISGGIGTAPMLFLEKRALAEGNKVINLIGGRSQEDLLAYGLSNCHFATDDGSAGFKGTVLELLDKELPGLGSIANLKVFACGPTPMLKAVAGFCRSHNILCDLSLESVMGCGFGICYGCSVEISNPDGSTRTILLCREGPVISAERIVL